jgi:hypothetical protein
LQAAPLREASDWVTQYRQHWEERLDRLEDYLAELQAQPTETTVPSASPNIDPITRTTTKTEKP